MLGTEQPVLPQAVPGMAAEGCSHIPTSGCCLPTASCAGALLRLPAGKAREANKKAIQHTRMALGLCHQHHALQGKGPSSEYVRMKMSKNVLKAVSSQHCRTNSYTKGWSGQATGAGPRSS